MMPILFPTLIVLKQEFSAELYGELRAFLNADKWKGILIGHSCQ